MNYFTNWFKGFDHIFQKTYFFKHLSADSGLLTYALLETNYDFINTLSLFENHIKNNFTQLTFKFQIKIKKLDTNLVESTHTNNRANLYYHVLIQVNTMWILNITNSLR